MEDMTQMTPKTKICKLEQKIINQIAAGEVLERPASALKEMIENSLDAHASCVSAEVFDGGKAMIRVRDDGCGMSREDLPLAIMRHATSKIQDIFAIKTFGFRGEALASICSVARCTISSREQNADGWYISAEGGEIVDEGPVNCKNGTTIEVSDMFYATPARMKFLKSTATEQEMCVRAFNHMALAFPQVKFSLSVDGKCKCVYENGDMTQRVEQIYGASFIKNAVLVDDVHGEITIRGYLSIPTYNKSTSQYMDVFVNNRAVRDKTLISIIRAAYHDFIPHGRYPQVALFINMPFEDVDVNAHPAKTEVRFRNVQILRAVLVSVIKHSIRQKELQTAEVELAYLTKMTQNVYERQTNSPIANQPVNIRENANPTANEIVNAVDNASLRSHANPYAKTGAASERCRGYTYPQYHADTGNQSRETWNAWQQSTQCHVPELLEAMSSEHSFGEAVCQIANKYIIATNEDEVVIVDQHAACERMLLEQIREQYVWQAQNLLIPSFVKLNTAHVERLMHHTQALQELGLRYERSDADSVMVLSMPSIIAEAEPDNVLQDIADELLDDENLTSLYDRIKLKMGKWSCYGSIRAGKAMNIEEMNNILRRMEKSQNIAQCTHGRPSFIRISVQKLDHWFER